MPVLGITGGIATGKSAFCKALLPRLPGTGFFDADAAARELLQEDTGVRTLVEEAFGPESFLPDGRPDRARLRTLVFTDPKNRRRLESILHPVIRARWTNRAAEHRQNGTWFCVDIPLLYETAAESLFDRVVVVACSPATQQRRLLDIRGLSAVQAQMIIGTQLDTHSKSSKADHLIWNDASFACLDRQSALLAGWLRQHYD